MALNISLPDLITRITQEFNEGMKSLMTFNTPSTPHGWIFRNQYIDINIYKRYRIGAGSLLYLVKNSQPELYDAVCELLKLMDKENMNH